MHVLFLTPAWCLTRGMPGARLCRKAVLVSFADDDDAASDCSNYGHCCIITGDGVHGPGCSLGLPGWQCRGQGGGAWQAGTVFNKKL